MHQVDIVRYGGRFHTGENPFGGAGLHRGLIHDPHGLLATVPSLGMGAEDDGVSRLDGHDALEEDSRRGVRNGSDREDEPDRFSHLHQTALRKLANDAHARFVPNVVVYEFRGHHVLHGLVFENPEPGFINLQAVDILSLVQADQDHAFDNAVDVLLGELRKYGGGGLALPDQSFEVTYAFVTEA